MKLLITGTTGFVGAGLLRKYPNAIASPSLRGMQERDIDNLVSACAEQGTEAIIHTAAVSDIGMCAQNPEESYHANVEIPIYLARVAEQKGLKLVCFSSDQVYSGTMTSGPYTEDDAAPENLYSREKLEMEQRVSDIAPTAVHLRAEWMYDSISPKGNYFLNVRSAEKEVTFSSTQFRGVTYLRNVAEQMDAVLRLPGGTYNFGSETTQSIYEITKVFLEMQGKVIRVNDCPGRHNLWMDCTKARKCGVVFPSVVEGLRQCLQDYHFI